VDQFKTDKVTISYVFTNEEPHICKQFGISANVGAVIFKPKRGKFVKMDGIDQNAMMIEPAKIATFLDNGLNSGSM